ncbi:sugar kinase [Pelagibacterium limicola]|uniref:sugar kinase n=1 Tax=Pelagibacterium limicola TaxID=2791022 RepID=UPI0018AF6E37|nr:sugar kinase [Pelagibacterium limicola]
MVGRVVSIGEAMIEMSGGADNAYRMGFAGDTLNTAYYLKMRLGDEWEVDYLTALGDDLYSRQMRTHIEGFGIGTAHVSEIKGKRPGLYMIHQADGDRHFTYWRDTSAAKLLADDKAALNKALDGADVIYFSGITLAILAPQAQAQLLGAIGERRRNGATVCFDPNIRPALWSGKDAVIEALTAAAGVSSIVLPTHEDEVPYFGDADDMATAQRYREAGAEEVVVKNGGNPALVVTAEGLWRVAAQKTDRVVDATGAGDSFNGGYLAARLKGADPETAAKAGHATAAIVIGYHGAIVPREKLEAAAQ